MGNSTSNFARWHRDAAKEEAAAAERIDRFILLNDNRDCTNLINDAFRLGQRRMRRRCMRQLADEIRNGAVQPVTGRNLAIAVERVHIRHWRTK